MPGWWGQKAKKEEDEDKQGDIEIKPPKEVEEKLNKIDGIEASVKAFEAHTDTLKGMATFLAEQKQIKEDARKKEADDRAKAATETNDEEWITDPKKAAQDMLQPLVINQINTNSRLIRRDIFDDGKEFEYYDGDFKKEVDNHIDSLPPAQRADPASIKNCYYVVLGRRQKEITEGKLKSRFSAASTASATQSTGKGSEQIIALTDEQKIAAKRLGVKEESYAKNFKEMVGI